jgi:hypothetical protein
VLALAARHSASQTRVTALMARQRELRRRALAHVRIAPARTNPILLRGCGMARRELS